jgi:hypothetical protein
MQTESETTPFKSFLALLCSATIIGILIVLTIHLIKLYYAKEQKAVLNNPSYTVGIISGVRTYKGTGVIVEYKVKSKEYSLNTAVTSKFLHTHQEGDTAGIIFLKTDPSIAILRADLKPAQISQQLVFPSHQGD